jgi:hypothetical protein
VTTVDPAPPERDPEFHTPVEPRLIVLDHAPETYQRLVANPFLAGAGFLFWLALVARLVGHVEVVKNPATPFIALGIIVVLFAIPRLLQYHCLDCGVTGRLAHWRRHVCAASAERRRQGRPRRLRGPTPPTQVILWLWVLLALGGILRGLWR